MNKEYLRNIQRLLDHLENTQEQVIEQVAAACAESIFNGGLLYFFGTGHSHMICEEPFYRAGGLASIYPILESDLMLHEGASKSSSYERIQGLGNVVVSHTPLGKGDVLFLISNSGRNCAIIDAALEAKKRGAITVAITSMNHTTQVTSRHSNGLNLYQVCDFVLDNGGVVGDASVLGKNTVAADVSLHLSISECISHEERRSTKKTRRARAKRNVRTVFFFTIATSSVFKTGN